MSSPDKEPKPTTTLIYFPISQETIEGLQVISVLDNDTLGKAIVDGLYWHVTCRLSDPATQTRIAEHKVALNAEIDAQIIGTDS